MTTIAYRNIFETGTVTVDSEDADYPKENAYDWLPYPGDVWKPAASGTHYITADMGSATAADYFAVHAHDIDTIKLQYSNDNFAADINDVDIPAQNLLKYSEELDNAAWTNAGISVLPNSYNAPDGTYTADLVTCDGVSLYPVARQYLATLSAGLKTLTSARFVKNVDLDHTVLFLRNNTTGNSMGVKFSFSSGVPEYDSVVGNLNSVLDSYSVTEVGDGWYRLSITVSFNTSFGATDSLEADQHLSWNAATTKSAYFWGAKLTEGAEDYPYIKTTSATYPAIAPDGNKLIYREFTSLASRYWRFEVVKASAASSLGVINLGEKLTIPESMQAGFSPANLARTNKYLNSTSDEGQFLGRRLISNGSSMNLSFNILTPEFARSSWDVFIQHAEVKPFFFAWNYDSYPTEVAFCWTTGKIKPPTYGSQTYMTASLKVKANT